MESKDGKDPWCFLWGYPHEIRHALAAREKKKSESNAGMAQDGSTFSNNHFQFFCWWNIFWFTQIWFCWWIHPSISFPTPCTAWTSFNLQHRPGLTMHAAVERQSMGSETRHPQGWFKCTSHVYDMVLLGTPITAITQWNYYSPNSFILKYMVYFFLRKEKLSGMWLPIGADGLVDYHF